MPNNQVTVVSLEALFAAPISAVISADFMAARQFAQYIQDYGFTPPSPPELGAAPPGEASATPHNAGFLGDLRMVSFSFDQPGGSGSPEPKTVKIPALSLVPLPLLQVQFAEFDFAVRVLEGTRDTSPRPLRLLAAPEASSLAPPRALPVAGHAGVSTARGRGRGSRRRWCRLLSGCEHQCPCAAYARGHPRWHQPAARLDEREYPDWFAGAQARTIPTVPCPRPERCGAPDLTGL